MKTTGIATLAWLGAIAVIVWAPRAHSQASDLVLLLSPLKNDFGLTIEDSLSVFDDADVDDAQDDFGLMEYDLHLRYPVFLEEKHELFVGTNFRWLDIDSRARLSESRLRLPGDLYDLSGTIGYRRWFRDNWMGGGLLRVGSASDELFHSGDEVYLKGTAFLSVPHLKYTAWLFFLNVDTDRDWPVVPGLAYTFPLSRQAYAIVGVPVIAAGGKIGERWDFYAGYIPLRNAAAEFNYAIAPRLKAGMGLQWQSQYFNRADRRDDDDRIEFNDKRISARATYSVFERLNLKLEAGYAFDRSIGEGEDWDDREDNEITLEDAWFGGLQFRFEF